MKKSANSLFIASVVAAASASSGQSHPNLDWAKTGSTVERCAGVAKKGGNDCGANGHACGGMAKEDRDPNEWIYMPKGLCDKLAGGKVVSSKVVGKKKKKK